MKSIYLELFKLNKQILEALRSGIKKVDSNRLKHIIREFQNKLKNLKKKEFRRAQQYLFDLEGAKVATYRNLEHVTNMLQINSFPQ